MRSLRTGEVALAPGALLFPQAIDPVAQAGLVAAVAAIAADAPFFRPVMPRTGRPFSVAMTAAGPLGWVSDLAGYRYSATHPATGRPWPAIPEAILALWDRFAGYPAPPECCLVNRYDEGARMGLHQDRDELALDAPVVSVSLGDTALFRIGGTARQGPTRSVRLASGDVVVLGGEARLAFHGIDRVLSGSSRLIPDGGRLNLTLRRVTDPSLRGA